MNNSKNMSETLNDEYESALDFLKMRLDGSLVDNCEKGDFAEGLLRHFRDRQDPPLLFTPDRLSDIAEAAERLDPEEYEWEKEIADNAVEGRVYGASNAYCRRFLELPDDFDFTEHPNPDPQTIHGICRHRWYASLAREYWRHQDRRYFDALMDHWDFFVRRVPFPDDESLLESYHGIGRPSPPAPWWQLDCYIRLKKWYWAHWLSLYAPEMTARRHAISLARCLRLFDVVASRGIGQQEHNFTSMQMESLYLWAAALPEVTGMSVWENAARANLESSLSRAVFEDGVQWEKSAGYHRGCMRWYGTPFVLGRRIGDPWPEEYADRLKKMAHFLDAIVTPDGKTPLLSDSDRVADWRPPTALMLSLWPDLELNNPVTPCYYSLWATNGTTWEKPEASPSSPTRVFPVGGVGVMRWPETMVILDNGPTNAGHSHFDNLTVHYEAFGRPILVDPGRHIYRRDADRDWVIKPQSHNLIMPEDDPIGIDDRGHAPALLPMEPEDARVDVIDASVEENYLRFRTGFRGYRCDPGARVVRTVAAGRHPRSPWLLVVDRVESAQAHQWTNSWLLPTDNPLERLNGAYHIRLDENLEVVMLVLGDLKLRDQMRFWCPNYNEHQPARWLRFSGAPQQEETRAFAFVPLQEAGGEFPSIYEDGGDVCLEWEQLLVRL